MQLGTKARRALDAGRGPHSAWGHGCSRRGGAAALRQRRSGAVAVTGAWWAHHRAGLDPGPGWEGPALLEERARCFRGPRGRPSAAAAPGGWTCASLAVVQVAVRSPCLASGQGRLLTVPEAVAEVDDEACGTRAAAVSRGAGEAVGQPGPARPLGAARRLPARGEAAQLLGGRPRRPSRLCSRPPAESHARAAPQQGAARPGARGRCRPLSFIH